MCGIAFAIGDSAREVFATLVDAVSPRGPDCHDTIAIEAHEHLLLLHASVLHLRGANLQNQPFLHAGKFLLYVCEAGSKRSQLNAFLERRNI